MNQYIEINPKICNGKPVVRGTRIPLTVVIDQLADGGSVEHIQNIYPELSVDQITGALR